MKIKTFSRLLAVSLSLTMIFGVVAVRSRLVAFADDSSTDASDTSQTASSQVADPSQGSDASDTSQTDNSQVVAPDASSSDDTSSNDASGTDADANLAPASDTLPTADASDTTQTSTDPVDPGNASGDASISTGNAGAVVDLTNVVNANIVDSQGFEELMNLFAPYLGNIDLSGISFTPASDCADCSGGSLDVTNNNTSTIENDVSVTANTGENSIDASGTAAISTGNATAVANIVNVANTNIVGSNYLLVVLNNFSQLLGDIIFPGQDFFGNMLGTDGSTAPLADSNLAVTNNNVATITNSSVTSADSGDNSVAGNGDGSSTISTGNATAVSNTVNDVNTNLTGNDQVYLLVRIFGTWNGQIFGTPPGLQWEQTPDGLLLTGAGASNVVGGSGSDTSDCGCNSSTTVTNNNNASVTNNVQVYALTGQNEIANGSNAPSSISTGNATAVANTVNLVNTNVVGHNILLAIINIFGDWEGNLDFGQPNLWVGADADTSANPLTPGSTVTYHVTVMNRGSSGATGVTLQSSDSVSGITSITDPGGGTPVSGGMSWSLPDLEPGASTTITYTAQVNGATQLPPSFTENFNAAEHEDDADPSDNSDAVTLGLAIPSNFAFNNTPLSQLFIHDTNNETSTLAPGTVVHYKLMLGDGAPNGPAKNVSVNETLYNPYGTAVSTSTWAIGNIEPGQKFLVQYDANFAASTPTGWYISYASLSGQDSGGNILPTGSTVSSSSVYIVNPSDTGAPPPAPPIVYVPAPTSTPTTTIGNNVHNPQVQLLPSSAHDASKVVAIAGPSCSAGDAPLQSPNLSNSNTTTHTNEVAAIGGIFSDQNATSLQSFFTSTILVLGSPFSKLW